LIHDLARRLQLGERVVFFGQSGEHGCDLVESILEAPEQTPATLAE
jgi:hypothetical protein